MNTGEPLKFVKIPCWGASLIVPEVLESVWPYDLLPEEWPTFCGAGDGLGDAIVPDTICRVRISPACLGHDIEWALTPDTFQAFMGANGRLFTNSVSLILAADLPVWTMIRAIGKAGGLYLMAVCTMGALFFEWSGEHLTADPRANPVVKARLQQIVNARLRAGARTKIPDLQAEEGELYCDDPR